MTFGLLRNYINLHAHADVTLRSLSHDLSRRAIPSLALVAAYCLKEPDESVNTLLPDVQGLWRVDLPELDCKVFLTTALSLEPPDQSATDVVDRLALRHSFPRPIVAEWIGQLGETETSLLCEALNRPAPTVVRVNTLIATVEECQRALASEGVTTHRTLLSPEGLILERRVNIPSLKAFRDGLFELQDEGSQLVGRLVQAAPGMNVVDACAGGGGKSLHMATLMKNQGTIIAMDVDGKRLENLRRRMERSQAGIIQLVIAGRQHSDMNSWKGKADRVLLDVPCSGVGTFRRNPGMKMTFKESFIMHTTALQSDILEKHSSLVRPGGRLVYATCSLLRAENQDQVHGFLSRHKEFSLVPAASLLTADGISVPTRSPFLELFPHETSTDGFFAAVLERELIR
jgi:16S rRNA (cytosine967-C5)-methyltransferase